MDIILSASTQPTINYLLESILERGGSTVAIGQLLTNNQLTLFINHIYSAHTQTDTLTAKRSISKSLVCFLHELSVKGLSHYADIRDLVSAKYDLIVNDYSSLKYWRLIEKAKESGFWKITERGKAFLAGELEIAETLSVKNNRVINASKERISISDFKDLDFISYQNIEFKNNGESI